MGPHPCCVAGGQVGGSPTRARFTSNSSLVGPAHLSPS